MAWNGSGSAGGSAAPQAPKKNGASSPLWLKGALAGLVVVAIGAAVLYMMRPEADKPEVVKTTREKATSIKEVPFHAVTQPKQPEEKVSTNAVKAKHDSRYDVPEGAYRDKRGFLRRPGGMRILEKPPARNINLSARKGKRVFENPSEEIIAELITADPSSAIIAVPDRVYGKGFEKNFLESLNTEIKDGPDDTDEVKALKADVRSVKAELKDRIAKGENVCDIMRETQKEMMRISAYKQNLQREIKNYAATHADATEQDIKDYVSAANEMMKKNGGGEIKLPKAFLRKLNIEGSKQ